MGGGITEKRQGRFGDAKSMPQIVSALKKAAYDPRITGIYLKMSPLSAGWAKLQEIRQYIDFFRWVVFQECGGAIHGGQQGRASAQRCGWKDIALQRIQHSVACGREARSSVVKARRCIKYQMLKHETLSEGRAASSA